MTAGQDVPRCEKCGRYPIGHRGGVCLYPEGPYTGDLEDLVHMVCFHVGAWEEFGYRGPVTPGCKTIPELGNRSADAVKGGHEAIRDVDALLARLHEVRAELVTQLRQDSDIRGARAAAMLARQERQS